MEALGSILENLSEVIAIIASVVLLIWKIGRWATRAELRLISMEDAIRDGFKQNREDHDRMGSRLDDHGRRLITLETYRKPNGAPPVS